MKRDSKDGMQEGAGNGAPQASPRAVVQSDEGAMNLAAKILKGRIQRGTLPVAEWDFDRSLCPDEEVPLCCHWEFLRESVTANELTVQLRSKFGGLHPGGKDGKTYWKWVESLSDAQQQMLLTLQRCTSPFPNHFPRPWLEMKERDRRENLKKAHINSHGKAESAVRLVPWDFKSSGDQPKGWDFQKVIHNSGFPNENWHVFELDFGFKDAVLTVQFANRLKEMRNERAASDSRGKRGLRIELKQLAVRRLLRVMSWDEAQAFTRKESKKGKALYVGQSRWIEAGKLAGASAEQFERTRSI